MPWYRLLLLLYLFLINLTAVLVTIWDKRCARRGKWRVPEHTLLLLSVLGGSPGMFITMRCIRHKTKKAKFMVGIPVILVLQLLIVGGVWYFIYK